MDNMTEHSGILTIFSFFFSLVLIIVGVLNIILVHPVPGIIYLLVSLIYLPPLNNLFLRKTGLYIPVLLKFILAIVIFMFTLGVSDLGDMIDKL
jgi:hypothetical protein